MEERRKQQAARGLWDSSDEEDSSEEDFEYLSQRLEETKTLPPDVMKMLRGVVSNQYQDRKYPGRFGRGQEVASDPE